jgi:hypothetical protein
MAANRVSSSIQGDRVPNVGRRPSRTPVTGAILVAGLILGMLALPVGLVSAETLEEPCLTCAVGSSVAAGAARFSDSGAAALLAGGDEFASPAVAAADARYNAWIAFYAAEYRPAPVAVRHNDSGLGALLATRIETPAVRFSDSGVAALLAAGSRPAAVALRHNDSGVGAFLATRSEAPAVRFSDSGAAALLSAPAAAATDARYSALVAFYAAEYRPAAVAVSHNDSGVAVALAVP